MVHGLVPGMAGEESSDGSPDDLRWELRWWLTVNGQMAQFRWLEMIVQMAAQDGLR